MNLERIKTPSFEGGGPRDFIRPPEKGLKVAYVIPIQGEIENGNIFHQLKDYARQNADHVSFEIIYVVNNTAKDALDKTKFFTENQRLLVLLEFASGKTNKPPSNLQAWELETTKTAREKNVKIQIIDLSTEGMEKKNIEEARMRGDNLAVKRFMQTNVRSDGAIVLMDADTRVGPQYTSEVISQLVNSPDVGMLKIQYDERPGEGGEKLYATTMQTRFSDTISNFMQLFNGYGQGGWYAIKAGALGIQKKEYASAMSRDVLRPKRGATKYATNLMPFTQDRARPIEIGGQFGGYRLASLNREGPQEKRDKTIVDPVLSDLSSLYIRLKEKGKLNGKIEQKVLSVLRKLIPDSDIDTYIGCLQKDKYPRWNEESFGMFERSKIPAPQYAGRALAMVAALIQESPQEIEALNRAVLEQQKREKIRHAHTSRGVDLLLERAFAQSNPDEITIQSLLAGRTETSFEHFLNVNKWIVDVLKTVRKEAASTNAARALLNQRFPELLVPFEETSYTKAQAVLLGVNEFIKRVRACPKDFPVAASVLVIE